MEKMMQGKKKPKKPKKPKPPPYPWDVAMVAFLFSFPVFATEKCKTSSSVNYVTEIRQSGIALNMATAQTNMDWSTDKGQISMGFGFHNNQNATAISFGKKPCQDCALVTGTLGVEGDNKAFGVGFTARF